jgi:hypothetical protein
VLFNLPLLSSTTTINPEYGFLPLQFLKMIIRGERNKERKERDLRSVLQLQGILK